MFQFLDSIVNLTLWEFGLWLFPVSIYTGAAVAYIGTLLAFVDKFRRRKNSWNELKSHLLVIGMIALFKIMFMFA